MKTHTFGWSHTFYLIYSESTPLPSPLLRFGAARAVYQQNRLNGDKMLDCPRRPFPFDGRYSSWTEAPLPGDRKGDYRIRYDEGPKDREWMQEMDNNYLSRLAANRLWEEFDRMKGSKWPDHLTEFATQLETDHRTAAAPTEVLERCTGEVRQAAARHRQEEPAQLRVAQTMRLPSHAKTAVTEEGDSLPQEQAKVSAERKALAYQRDQHERAKRAVAEWWQKEEERAEQETLRAALGGEHSISKVRTGREATAYVEQPMSKIIALASMAQVEGRHQDVLRLLDTYLSEHPRSVAALRLRANSREQLASFVRSHVQNRRLLEAAAVDYNALLDIDVADADASDGLDRVNALLNPPAAIPSAKTSPLGDAFERLRRVWKGKYGEPVYVPDRAKPAGSAVGALYLKHKTKPGAAGERRLWFGKMGSSPNKQESGILSAQNLFHRWVPVNAIHEKVAADAYDLLSGDAYIVPKHRLSRLPLVNAFTHSNAWVQFVFSQLNDGDSEQDVKTVHVMSKWLEGYRNLHNARVRIGSAVVPIMEYIESQRRVPERIMIEGRAIPLIGMMEILAASRLLGDIDALGVSGENAGFIIERDTSGAPTCARAVKIDVGYAFSFRVEANLFYQSFHPEAISPLADLRDIQFAAEQRVDIQWSRLSDVQRQMFLRALKSGLDMLNTPRMLATLINRDGAFNKIESGLLARRHVDKLVTAWGRYLKLQERDDVYGFDLAALDSAPAGRL